jgi:hypothetical protein
VFHPYIVLSLLFFSEKCVRWTLRVTSIHGLRAPLPFLQSVKVVPLRHIQFVNILMLSCSFCTLLSLKDWVLQCYMKQKIEYELVINSVTCTAIAMSGRCYFFFSSYRGTNRRTTCHFIKKRELGRCYWSTHLKFIL